MAKLYWPDTSIDVNEKRNVVGKISGYSPWGNGDFPWTYTSKFVTRLRRKQNVKTALATHGYLPILSFTANIQTSDLILGESSTHVPLNGGGSTTYRVTDNHSLPYFDWEWSFAGNPWAGIKNDAISDLQRRVRDQRVSTIETIYEGRKTSKMILETLGTLTKSLRAVKRGRIGEAAKLMGILTPASLLPKRHGRINYNRRQEAVINPTRTSKELADRWLAYRYGWIPLYSTVYGSMTVMHDKLKAKNQGNQVYFVKSGKHRFQYGPNVRHSPSLGLYAGRSWGSITGGYCIADYAVQATQSGYFSGRATAVIRVTNDNLSTASQLGLTNPLLVAWELVPFSFVFDWFVNVSDVLASHDAWAGKQYLTGSYTLFGDHSLTAFSYEKSKPNVSPFSTGITKKAESRKGWKHTEREVLTIAPTVNLAFSIGLNPTRVTDAVALFRQIAFRK